MKKKIKRPDLAKINRERYIDKTWEQFHGKDNAKELRKNYKKNCKFKEINESRKGKTLEEIYGKEKAEIIKAEIRKKGVLKKLNKSRKGKTYEDIYSPNKVKEYKAKLSKAGLKRKYTRRIKLDFNEVLKVYKKLKSCDKTGKYFKCSHGIISRILKENNFPLLKQESPKKLNLNEEEVIELYKKLKNTYKVAKEFNCSIYPIVCILKKHDIQTYGFQGSNGKDNNNWRGGLSFEPYTPEFNIKFKNIIRKRDNQVCMLCGIHREKIWRALSIHHINYIKEITIPQNCISLCDTCHGLTNSNRKHWTKLFQSLLSEKYGYEYSEEKDIIIDYKL